MNCQKCGHENQTGANFCAACGASLDPFAAPPPVSPSATGRAGDERPMMSFGDAITTCLRKYAEFNGRATRAEYWWFYLFTLLVGWGSGIADSSGTLSLLVNLALLLPTIAAAARRLHDTGRSGWWQLIAFTVIGLIPLIWWLASQGDDGDNAHGAPAAVTG